MTLSITYEEGSIMEERQLGRFTALLGFRPILEPAFLVLVLVSVL